MSMLYWDCQTGISGDMVVASLLDLGASEEAVRHALEPLQGEGFTLRVSRVVKSGLDCCDFDVALDALHDNHDHDMAYLYPDDPDAVAVHHHDHEHHHEGAHGTEPADHEHDHCHDEHHHHGHHHRSYADVKAILASLDLTPRARRIAEDAFLLVARAESKAHGLPVDQVHFHEVGAIDSIVDVVAAAVCLDGLGIDQVVVPSVTEGSGLVRCQHGMLPVPVPAVVNIAAMTGLPLHQSTRRGELVTPTGAALAAAVMTSDQLPQRFRVLKVGLGAGKRAYQVPSILRAMLIEPLPDQTDAVASHPTESGATGDVPSSTPESADTICKLECNIDDSTGEMLGAVLTDLMDAGARDAHFLPVYMKKNRPAYELAVICDDEHREALEQLIFRETTTIGIRRQRMERSIMDVSFRTAQTAYGPVRLKVCRRGDVSRAYPEYDSVMDAARRAQTDFRSVYLAAATSAADADE
ncbi:MAG: nickel pincer cofactor biosynthesis protein LarC [Atopobiaceae bacterium]